VKPIRHASHDTRPAAGRDRARASAARVVSPEREEAAQNQKAEPVPIGKIGQFFRNMLEEPSINQRFILQWAAHDGIIGVKHSAAGIHAAPIS
jgi:hypothetical protein